MGNMHGDIAVASNGEIYVSVMDAKAPIQVYAPDGHFLRVVEGAPQDFHGFVIHKDADGVEYIYGPRLVAGNIVKLTLDGKEVLNIPPSAIPDEFKNKEKDGKASLKLTGMDVAPNGDLYVTDGYGADYIHHFDKTGKYLESFGGRKEPYNFSNLHKLAIDTRFQPVRLIVTDRGHNRLIHLSLDGKVLGVVATDLRKPSAVAIYHDELVVGELNGRVTVLDKDGKVLAHVGTNETADEIGTNRTEPDKWKVGVIDAAHGVACDAKGDIFVSEWNIFGRVHRFDRK
jgi:sugar lactone lactonase YvrE